MKSKSRRVIGTTTAILVCFFIVGGVTAFGEGGLIISEYIEGSGNNKAVELYNGTSSSIDLSSYQLEIYHNGTNTPGPAITLPAVISPGGTYIVAHPSATNTITDLANKTTGNIDFNGDDAVVLRSGDTIVDCLGQVGFDPGTEWGSNLTSTADNTLRRKPDVLFGDTNAFDTFDPAVEWDGYANNTFDGLGSHTMNQPLAVTVTITNAESTSDGLVLQWEATGTNPLNYTVVARDDLFGLEWVAVSPKTPATAWTNTIDPSTSRFYRVTAEEQ
jgi:uncharacterized protein